MTDLESYDIQGEPERGELSYLWRTAIGLQKTDGLTVSDYLISVANRNINGEITLKEAHDLIEDHYKARPTIAVDENRDPFVTPTTDINAKCAKIQNL